jgi:hypothetical protein
MDNENRLRLDAALLRNKRRHVVEQWMTKLATACGQKIESDRFLELDKVELIRASFLKSLQERRTSSVWWEAADVDSVTQHLSRLARQIGAIPVILFSNLDNALGVGGLPADCILLNAFAVWTVVENDLNVVTETLRDGLCLELNYYTPSGDYVADGVYELSTWGIFNLDVDPQDHA